MQKDKADLGKGRKAQKAAAMDKLPGQQEALNRKLSKRRLYNRQRLQEELRAKMTGDKYIRDLHDDLKVMRGMQTRAKKTLNPVLLERIRVELSIVRSGAELKLKMLRKLLPDMKEMDLNFDDASGSIGEGFAKAVKNVEDDKDSLDL